MVETVTTRRIYFGEGTPDSPYYGLAGELAASGLKSLAADHLGEIESGRQIFVDVNGWKFQIEKALDTRNLLGYIKVSLIELGLSKNERPSLQSAQDAVFYSQLVYSSFLGELIRRKLSL